MEEKEFYSKLREVYKDDKYFFHNVYDGLEGLSEEQKDICDILYEVMNLEIDEDGSRFVTYQGKNYNSVLKENRDKYISVLSALNQEEISDRVKARVNDILFIITGEDRFLSLAIDTYKYAFALYETGEVFGRVVYEPINRALFLSGIAKSKHLPIAESFLSYTWKFIENHPDRAFADDIVGMIYSKDYLDYTDTCLIYFEKRLFGAEIADSYTDEFVERLTKHRGENKDYKRKLMRKAAEITKVAAMANDYIPERNGLLGKAIDYAIDSVDGRADEDDFVVELCKLKEESNKAILDNIGHISIPYEKDHLDLFNSVLEHLEGNNSHETTQRILVTFLLVTKSNIENNLKKNPSSTGFLFKDCIYSEDIPFEIEVPDIIGDSIPEARLIFKLGQFLEIDEYLYFKMYDVLSSQLKKEGDFSWVFKDNPIVPADRQERIAKAFLIAFTIDFGIGVNAILPEVENVFRFLVKEAGGLIYSPSKKKMHSLGALLSSKWIKEMLDEDYLFNFKALMVESYSANIRNYRLHGNYSGEYPSVYEIYLVFLLLKWFYMAKFGGIIESEEASKCTNKKGSSSSR